MPRRVDKIFEALRNAENSIQECMDNESDDPATVIQEAEIIFAEGEGYLETDFQELLSETTVHPSTSAISKEPPIFNELDNRNARDGNMETNDEDSNTFEVRNEEACYESTVNSRESSNDSDF
ncbi:uncharacterized protein LOC123320810 [Coccinella septempunctata]|uniref:uncharacterized protein LOC123320810 n=1 Tax=Coccinella septempunctata TaxID=41139 RepID=UPI001D06B548|nr:uncharacterized protein LOC123320810 [Coccinella septempunctata]